MSPTDRIIYDAYAGTVPYHLNECNAAKEHQLKSGQRHEVMKLSFLVQHTNSKLNPLNVAIIVVPTADAVRLVLY